MGNVENALCSRKDELQPLANALVSRGDAVDALIDALSSRVDALAEWEPRPKGGRTASS
jgi:hypothetical protein